jgi:hypothetical protein
MKRLLSNLLLLYSFKCMRSDQKVLQLNRVCPSSLFLNRRSTQHMFIKFGVGLSTINLIKKVYLLSVSDLLDL